MSNLFPRHVDSPDAAIHHLWGWCDVLGAELTGAELTGGRALVRPETGGMSIRGVRFAFHGRSTALSIDLNLDGDLVALRYRFDYRVGDRFLWRADKHPGHETELGGMCHLHIGPSEHARGTSPDFDLGSIAERIMTTNRGLNASTNRAQG